MRESRPSTSVTLHTATTHDVTISRQKLDLGLRSPRLPRRRREIIITLGASRGNLCDSTTFLLYPLDCMRSGLAFHSTQTGRSPQPICWRALRKIITLGGIMVLWMRRCLARSHLFVGSGCRHLSRSAAALSTRQLSSPARRGAKGDAKCRN